MLANQSLTLHKTQLSLENFLMETFEASTDSWNTARKAEHKTLPDDLIGFLHQRGLLIYPLCDSIKTLHMKTLVCTAKGT